MTTDDERLKWFEAYMDRTEASLNTPHQQEASGFLCPCCGYPTLGARAQYEICFLCGWEDDGQDDPHAEEVWGGPNGDYSLAEARRNFATHRTSYRITDRRHFPRTQEPKVIQLKEALIAVYERMRVAETEAQRQALKAEEEALLKRL